MVPPVNEVLQAFENQDSLFEIGEEVATGEEEDINGHDSTQDMVRAVVRDLATFMKAAQELRPLKNTINPTKSKDPDKEPANPPKALEPSEDDDRGLLANSK
jgi:cob(I)alamin adenosyltransferase